MNVRTAGIGLDGCSAGDSCDYQAGRAKHASPYFLIQSRDELGQISQVMTRPSLLTDWDFSFSIQV